jgi:hypothetical protein
MTQKNTPPYNQTTHTKQNNPPQKKTLSEGPKVHEVPLDRHTKLTPEASDAVRRELHQIKPDGEGFFKALLNSDGADVVLYVFTVTHPHLTLGPAGPSQHVTLGFRERSEAVAWYISVAAALGEVASTDPEWKALKASGAYAGHGANRLTMSWQPAM